MAVADTMKRVIKQQGRTQKWVVEQMNVILPEHDHLNNAKFSAIVRGKRTMSGDELLAFCKATGISPDEFLNPDDADTAQ